MLRKITIKHKVFAIAIMGALLAVFIATKSINSIDSVGKKLEQIAEEDIPLTNKVTEITLHQLEQAILFERAARYAEVYALKQDLRAKQNFEAVKEEFFVYAKKVDKEILETEKFAAEIIKHEEEIGGSQKILKEFRSVQTLLKQIKKEHVSYDDHVKEAFSLLETGDLSAAEKMFVMIEEEQGKLNHALEDLVLELEGFTAEAALDAEHLEHQLISSLKYISAVMTLIFICIAYVVVRSIIKPLLDTRNFAEELSAGKLDAIRPKHKFEDEIAEMMQSLEVFREGALEAERLKREQAEQEILAAQEQKKAMLALADDFENQVGGMISSLAAASTELQATAESMKGISDDTKHSSQTVAASSEESSVNVNTVAAAMEEMSASADEISQQMILAKQKSQDTSVNAKDANDAVSNLSELADNIGGVVTAIQDIAEQTNLLALNATIEAARAGEAGKGFAVVADEVKKLANETGQKTEEISQKISEIQGATHSSVEVMGKIINNVGDIDTSIVGVSGAVEEQNATISEIARSVAEASQGAQEVSQVIIEVQRGAEETGVSADAVLDAAQEVAQFSETLKVSVESFLSDVRRDNHVSDEGKAEAAIECANDDADVSQDDLVEAINA